jgi:hypothetical protein
MRNFFLRVRLSSFFNPTFFHKEKQLSCGLGFFEISVVRLLRGMLSVLTLILAVSPVRPFINISISNINEHRNTLFLALMTYGTEVFLEFL